MTKKVLSHDGWASAQWKAEGRLYRLMDQVHNLPLPYPGNRNLTRERRKAARATYAELRSLMAILLSAEVL